MTEKRVNPDTGVLEEKHWYGWTPSENAEGREERVNPETGVQEERHWHGWTPSENAEGREERVNPETGVQEEKHWYGWTPSENAEGREERVNPETGVQEERHWHGWTPSENAEGHEERVNPETGVQEERHWHGWTPSENSGSGLRPPPAQREKVEEIQQMLREINDGQDQTSSSEHDTQGDDRTDSEYEFYTAPEEEDDSDSRTVIAESDNESVYLTRSGAVQVQKQERTSLGFAITTTTFNTVDEYKRHLSLMKMFREMDKTDV